MLYYRPSLYLWTKALEQKKKRVFDLMGLPFLGRDHQYVSKQVRSFHVMKSTLKEISRDIWEQLKRGYFRYTFVSGDIGIESTVLVLQETVEKGIMGLQDWKMCLSLQEPHVRARPVESLLKAGTFLPRKRSYRGIQSAGFSGQRLASHHSFCNSQWERCGIVQMIIDNGSPHSGSESWLHHC